MLWCYYQFWLQNHFITIWSYFYFVALDSKPNGPEKIGVLTQVMQCVLNVNTADSRHAPYIKVKLSGRNHSTVLIKNLAFR